MLLVMVLMSCDHKKSGSESYLTEEVLSDSSWNDSDEMVLEPETEIDVLPENADELFDDFVYEFAQSKKIQLGRVRFPLPLVRSKGDTLWVSQKEWKHDYLYLKQDSYTVFFNNMSQMDLEKRTDLNRVLVDHINLKEKKYRTYHFERIGGKWMLTQESFHGLQESPLYDFLNFYNRFATDSAYQYAHINEPIKYTTADPDDDFSTIEGTLSREQWAAFGPFLPLNDLTNVCYGQVYRNPSRMILVKKGVANGMMDILTFQRESGEWRLSAYEN